VTLTGLTLLYFDLRPGPDTTAATGRRASAGQGLRVSCSLSAIVATGNF
jgi:hypothetical protein